MRLPQASAAVIGIDAVAATCRQVDVVIALTTSRMPVVPVELPAQVLAVGVGAFKPEMAELPPALLHAREVAVDHLAGARHEAGNLLQAGIGWNKVRDIADVLIHGMERTVEAPLLRTVGHAA